jgi:hypothetical protein
MFDDCNTFFKGPAKIPDPGLTASGLTRKKTLFGSKVSAVPVRPRIVACVCRRWYLLSKQQLPFIL